jgi:hypothetical protein
MSPYNLISPSMSVAPPPSVAVTLAINPSNFTLGSHVELSATAVSNASYPITVDTWPNIFNPGLSQQRGSLVGVDKDTHKELEMHVIDVRMNAEFLNDRTLGGVHDEYLVTLEPGQTRAFNTFFYTAVGDIYHKPDVLPGHRYLIDLEESEQVGWWKKEERKTSWIFPGKIEERVTQMASLSH